MSPLRIIARLDIKGDNVVKGVRFEGLRILGKPDAMATAYYDWGVDEIVFVDTVASLYGRNNIVDVVSQAAGRLFVPMTVGGGIRTIDDIEMLLRAGADKVAINTAAVRNPRFLSQAAERFGSQCIVLNVEAKTRGPGRWEVFTDNGREATGRDALDWVDQAQGHGIGEVLVTSVDKEGTRKGLDIELQAAIRARVRVPLIAGGGVGSIEHIERCVSAVDIDAVACASILHYRIETVPDIKRKLQAAGIPVRPFDGMIQEFEYAG